MKPLLYLFVLIVFLALVWGLQWIRQQANKGINRAVFHNRHKRGQTQIRNTVKFHTSVTPVQVLSAIKTSVNAQPAAHPVIARLYLLAEAGDGVAFAFGSKLGESFRVLVQVSKTEDGGTKGIAHVTNWTEIDGLVSNVNQLEKLFQDIAAGVRAVDAQADVVING